MKENDDIDRLFKSALEEREFDITPDFVENLEESLDQQEDLELDDFFKNKLEERIFVFDDSYVADLNQKLDNRSDEKKRKTIYWWLIGLGLLFLGGIFCISRFSNDKSQQLPTSGASIETMTIIDSDELTSENVQKNIVVTNVNYSHEPNEHSEVSLFNKSTVKKLDEQLLSSDTNSSRKHSFQTYSRQKQHLKKTTNNNEFKPKIHHDKQVGPIGSAPTHLNATNFTPKIGLNPFLKRDLYKIDTESNYLSLPDIPLPNTLISNQSLGTMTVLNEDSKTETEQSIDSVDLADSADPAPDFSDVDNSNGQFSIQAAFGINYVSKKFDKNSGIYIDKRKEEEKEIITPSFDLNVNYHLSNWQIKSGINYSSFGEKLAYNNLIQTIIFDTAYVTDISGNIDTIYTPIDTITTSDPNSNLPIKNNINKYHYLTIPIGMGYTFNLPNSGFSITPRFGIGLRFALNTTGNYISEEMDKIILLEESRFQMSYHASMALGYKWKKIGIYFEPKFDSNFKTFNDIHRYRSFGLNFGMTYFL
ncbi:hypothetical protein [Crocinitomix catalasitica]|uniref:hypothetical protein n=1 Tax=Crocinitomix catalasitica TaxID=184607 RepID=UPI000485F122|nr:hypothetical protein [Crocinitomix catalasitica]